MGSEYSGLVSASQNTFFAQLSVPAFIGLCSCILQRCVFDVPRHSHSFWDLELALVASISRLILGLLSSLSSILHFVVSELSEVLEHANTRVSATGQMACSVRLSGIDARILAPYVDVSLRHLADLPRTVIVFGPGAFTLVCFVRRLHENPRLIVHQRLGIGSTESCCDSLTEIR